MTGRLYLCTQSELARGAQVVHHFAGAAPKRSILVVATAKGPRAYWNVCQHLPVPLDGGAGQLAKGPDLVCITHGARYRPADGLCVEGPCEGESLEPITLEAVGEELYAVL